VAFIAFHCVFVFALGLPWPSSFIERQHSWMLHYSNVTGIQQKWHMFALSRSQAEAQPFRRLFWVSARVKFDDGPWEEWPLPRCSVEGGYWEIFRHYRNCYWMESTLVRMALTQSDDQWRGAAIVIAQEVRRATGKAPTSLLLVAHPHNSTPPNFTPEQNKRRRSLAWGDRSFQIDFKPGEVL
jgi:hypothetical protein